MVLKKKKKGHFILKNDMIDVNDIIQDTVDET